MDVQLKPGDLVIIKNEALNDVCIVKQEHTPYRRLLYRTDTWGMPPTLSIDINSLNDPLILYLGQLPATYDSHLLYVGGGLVTTRWNVIYNLFNVISSPED